MDRKQTKFDFNYGINIFSIEAYEQLRFSVVGIIENFENDWRQ